MLSAELRVWLHYRWQHGCWDSMRHRQPSDCTSRPGGIIKYPKLPKAQSTWNAAGEDSWESLDSKEIKPVNPKGSQSWIFIHWKDWCWSWSSKTLATWCKELTHLKRPWSWERLRAGGEEDDRGWDGWMVSPTKWTWVWVDSGSWWWTGRPGVLQFMESQRVGHDWVTELNWTESRH